MFFDLEFNKETDFMQKRGFLGPLWMGNGKIK